MNEDQTAQAVAFVKAIQAKAKKDKEFAKAIQWLAQHFLENKAIGYRNMGRLLWDEVFKPLFTTRTT